MSQEFGLGNGASSMGYNGYGAAVVLCNCHEIVSSATQWRCLLGAAGAVIPEESCHCCLARFGRLGGAVFVFILVSVVELIDEAATSAAHLARSSL